jgi:hypothetical protein
VLTDAALNVIDTKDWVPSITPGGIGQTVLSQLADTSSAANGAGLVGYNSAQAYSSGTVGWDLNAPRPISRGGTGATTDHAALANLGVVDVGAETTINGTISIPNVFPASYLITDSGSPAYYAITLPPAAAVGAVVYFRVLAAAVKWYSLYDGGTLFDNGTDRITLWAGESVMLLKTTTGWVRLGGRQIPMRGVLSIVANQAIPAATWTPVQFTTPAQDSSGLNLCYDSTNKCFKAVRAGTYRFTASLQVRYVTAGSEGYGALSKGNIGQPNNVGNPISIVLAQAGLNRLSHNLSTVQMLAMNELMGAGVWGAAGGGIILEYVAGSIWSSMSYEEVLT